MAIDSAVATTLEHFLLGRVLPFNRWHLGGTSNDFRIGLTPSVVVEALLSTAICVLALYKKLFSCSVSSPTGFSSYRQMMIS